MKQKLYLLILLTVTGLYSCKKEVYEQSQQFGAIRFNNQSGLTDLKLKYNNDLYMGNLLSPVKMPAGKGLFSFIDPETNAVLLDTNLAVEANTSQEIVLFRPDENSPLVLLKNTQSEEPAPNPGKLKIKIANLARKALPDDINVIVYGFDDNYFDFVLPLDTLEHVSRTFSDDYITINNTVSVNDPSLVIHVVNAKTQEILTLFTVAVDNVNWETFQPYNILTLYLRDEEQGVPIKDSNYSVSCGTLFKN